MSKKAILIFDINPSFRELLEVIFLESAYRVVSSDSSKDAVQQIDFHRPYVVLINTWLSGDNAFKIMHHIRQDLYFNNIPVILLGINFNLAAIKNEVGADDYILQPFDIDELEYKMDRYSYEITI